MWGNIRADFFCIRTLINPNKKANLLQLALGKILMFF